MVAYEQVELRKIVDRHLWDNSNLKLTAEGI